MSSFTNYNDSTNFKPSRQISNLTKNLQQHSDSNKFIPSSSLPSATAPTGSSYPDSYNETLNFIPSGHNTPTHIASSYLSSYNHSYSHSFKPPSIPSAIPTTSIDTHESLLAKNQRFPNSFPSAWRLVDNANFPAANPNTQTSNFNHRESDFNQPVNDRRDSEFSHFSNLSQFPPINTSFVPQLLPPPDHYNSGSSFSQSTIPQSFDQTARSMSIGEPDHYMSYKEFLTNLTLKDQHDGIEDNEHLNIVDYPVQDLIVMLSCLLTKIIEANDKLHPNHFDNTIAIRQKLKEERKERKRQKMAAFDHDKPMSREIDVECVEVDDDDLDEEDEMKNKYLANVLAFHGTNVPGISLHAYLARVLKYCPVTNEVFLSLLVYFDRIAKKANNFKKKKEDESEDSPEQLFVMDSYNIHRLIISGITVSSKFFSDIFYKNLRYAKVGGLPLEELNYLELQFLLLLDFKLMISVEDLQNYADLLLRFWKREQLTNEIINNENRETHQV
mgnify:CR=1 FL=1